MAAYEPRSRDAEAVEEEEEEEEEEPPPVRGGASATARPSARV
jgi:hypothetical protein